ncbi:tRNA-guanine transglycosylase [Coemansia reversa NRRL 1564]|uniref:tRNA-guanine transglycosylase n=1 Tax=Coemansia reversa (strain ATCC 12441 / NRRL 1564) TaxID=763665 RepID=A0A2G5BJ35_COERN|nr:tRNA-guanine transglycosylase [Coemansia reversa NRRL 1564]|eukprot:PIA19044.1 tRNA-guanine transglycosylase [Coemansia reversa NRRL 1564]
MDESELVVLDVLDPICKQRISKLTDKHIGIPSDGGMRRLTPEMFSRAVQALKPDIVVPPADYVAEPPVAGNNRMANSVRRTARWLDESTGHAAPILVPVMGARSIEQREAWARIVAARNDVWGYVLNDTGLEMGLDDTLTLAKHSLGLLDASKLRYMVGASAPDAVLRAVLSGIDLVDSSYAFAVTEQGFASAYTLHGDDHGAAHVDLWHSSMADDFRPLVEDCTCFACRRHHRAYVHHLLTAHEMLATVLLQAHNLHCYQRFFADVRASIAAGSLAADAARFATRYSGAFDELHVLATQPFSPSSKAPSHRHNDPLSIANN